MTLLSILNLDYSHLYNYNELLLLSKTLSTLPAVGGICKTFRQQLSRLNFLKQVGDARKLH